MKLEEFFATGSLIFVLFVFPFLFICAAAVGTMILSGGKVSDVWSKEMGDHLRWMDEQDAAYYAWEEGEWPEEERDYDKWEYED